MKKIFSLVLIFALVCAYKIPFKRLFENADGLYTITVGEGSSGSFYTFNASDEDCFKGLYSVTGQSLQTKNKEYIENFLEVYFCKLVIIEIVEGMTVKYYYSPKISTYRSINGKKVNVQTCFKDDEYTIGSPLIYCGF